MRRLREPVFWWKGAILRWNELWQGAAARDCLKEALALVPDVPAAAAMLIEFEAEESKWQEQAEALSKQAAEVGEVSAAAPISSPRRVLLRHRSVVDEAEALFRRALQLDRRTSARIWCSNAC